MAPVCTICNKVFARTSNLRVHVRRFHPDKLEDIAPITRIISSKTCNECDKSFSRYSSFIKHVTGFHNKIKNECAVKPDKLFKCSLCDLDDLTRTQIWSHFETEHGIGLKSEVLKFSNLEEFYVWKEQLQKETRFSYINGRGTISTNNYVKRRYICHRSSSPKVKGSDTSHSSDQGNNKINGFCPAEINIAIFKDGECEVEFVAQHVGHGNDLEWLALTTEERELLTSRISANIPFDTILSEIKNSASDNLHRITKRDLRSIRQSLTVTAGDNIMQMQDKDEKHCITQREEQNLDELAGEKAKLMSKLTRIVDNVSSYEELEVLEKSLSPLLEGQSHNCT